MSEVDNTIYYVSSIDNFASCPAFSYSYILKKLNKKFINQWHKKLRLYKNKNKVIEHDSAKHVQLVYARTSGGGRHAARVWVGRRARIYWPDCSCAVFVLYLLRVVVAYYGFPDDSCDSRGVLVFIGRSSW